MFYVHQIADIDSESLNSKSFNTLTEARQAAASDAIESGAVISISTLVEQENSDGMGLLLWKEIERYAA